MSCDDPDCLVCPLIAVVQRMEDKGTPPDQILSMALSIVGDALGIETAILEAESGSIH